MAGLSAFPDDGRIRFAPSILQRLGEELNPNVDQGLLELVKNAYDADATECHIWLDGEHPGGRVVIEDNGVGMRIEEILSGWLVLGDSKKSSHTRTPRFGRTPAGNKGLGRLAALRLGREARMLTRPGSGREYRVALNWDRFDQADTVDEVVVPIGVSDVASKSTGTRIELVHLRDTIGRVDVRRLARALVLLADPFGDQPDGFSPILHSAEYSDLAEQVQKRYFDQAEYHLRATLKDGVAIATVYDWQGRAMWESGGEPLGQRGGATYDAPDSTLDFWVFILDQKTFTGRNVQLSAVREWLGHFGGAHVYVNGLRVAPYGNPGNDWLDINLRRAQSPENRPSTNTSIGRLSVADPEGVLTQKTDRSGFIDSPVVAELTRFASDALEWMARQRQQEAERRRQQNRERAAKEVTTETRAVREQIDQISDGPAKRELAQAFEQYTHARDREADTLRKELQLYRTLSTAGITAATFAHESNASPLKTISIINNTLKKALAIELPGVYETKYSKRLDQIGVAVSELGVLTTATLDLIGEQKRRVGKVQPNQVVRNIADVFAPFLDGRKVTLELELSGPGEPFLRGSEAAVESIVTNLINNSLSAFERSATTYRRIRISTRVIDSVWEMAVDDNGPGIEGISLKDIWLPGQTLRPGGTGLGLTIVRDTVTDLGGDVDARSHGELGGAKFLVSLALLGVDRA